MGLGEDLALYENNEARISTQALERPIDKHEVRDPVKRGNFNKIHMSHVLLATLKNDFLHKFTNLAISFICFSIATH